MRVLVLFSFISTAICTCANAQEGDCNNRLEGRIVEKGTNDAMWGATIVITELGKGEAVGEDGAFKFSGLCPGSYTLEVKHVGYKVLTQNVSIPTTSSLTIQLESETYRLEDVVVTEKAEKDPTRNTEILDAREFEAAKGKSLAESIKSITGVTTLQTGPTIAKPVIHGLHSNRVLILNNGIRQEGQQWGSEHAPEIDPFIASEITVVKGADAVRYGSDAIAGLILVEPPKMHTNTNLGGELNLGYISNNKGYFVSGLLEGGLGKSKKFAWRLQGTGKYFGDSKTPDYILSNTGLREQDISGALGYFDEDFGAEIYYSRFASELGILSASHIGNLTDLMNAINSDEPIIIRPFTYDIRAPRQEIVHHLVKVDAFWNRPGGTIKLKYGGQINDREEYDIRRVSSDDRPSLALMLYSHNLDLSWTSLYSQNSSTEVGLSYSYQENDNVPGTGVRPLIPDFNNNSIGLYGIQKLIGNKWLLEAGGRADLRQTEVLTFDSDNELVRPTYDFNNIAFTLGFDYDLGSNFRYTTNASTAFRPPHVSELFSQGLHHGTASIEEGLFIDEGELIPGFEDQNPKSETAIKWIHSLKYFSDNLEIELAPYISWIDNFIFLEPQQELRLTIRGAFPVFKYKQTNARFTGFDAAINYHLSESIEAKFKSSIVRGRNTTIDDWLIFMPSDRYELSLHYEKPELGGLKDFHLSLGGLAVTEQTRVPPNSDIKEPPPAYFLVNFHTGFAFDIADQKFNLYLNVDNLLNTTYRDYLNRFRYYADDTGLNVTIRLKYNFHSHN